MWGTDGQQGRRLATGPGVTAKEKAKTKKKIKQRGTLVSRVLLLRWGFRFSAFAISIFSIEISRLRTHAGVVADSRSRLVRRDLYSFCFPSALRTAATTPAWVLSRGIEMAKTENRKPKTAARPGSHPPTAACLIPRFSVFGFRHFDIFPHKSFVINKPKLFQMNFYFF